jgi:hypothetical protein
MCSLRKGVQPILQPDYTHEEAQRLQTLRLRHMRKTIPEKSRSQETQRLAARGGCRRGRGKCRNRHCNSAAVAAATAGVTYSPCSSPVQCSSMFVSFSPAATRLLLLLLSKPKICQIYLHHKFHSHAVDQRVRHLALNPRPISTLFQGARVVEDGVGVRTRKGCIPAARKVHHPHQFGLGTV